MDFEKLYIDGAWVPSASDKWIEVRTGKPQRDRLGAGRKR